MTKTVKVPVGLGNPDKPDDPPTYLEPGDDVPSWAEEHIPDEYMEDGPVAGGVYLVSDQIYQVVKSVADERGVEYGEDWSADQIAAAIRLAEHNDDLTARIEAGLVDEDEGTAAVEDSKSAMDALFSDSNKSGNAAAPNQDEKPTRAKSTSKSTGGSSGGADS